MKYSFEDPSHPGNSVEHHTGKECIEDGCSSPAGTAWSMLFCQKHNAERIKRITRQLDEVLNSFKPIEVRNARED